MLSYKNYFIVLISFVISVLMYNPSAVAGDGNNNTELNGNKVQAIQASNVNEVNENSDHFVYLLEKYYQLLIQKEDLRARVELTTTEQQKVVALEGKINSVAEKIENKFHVVRQHNWFVFLDYKVMSENEKVDALVTQLADVYIPIHDIVVTVFNKTVDPLKAESYVSLLLAKNEKLFQEWEAEMLRVYKGGQLVVDYARVDLNEAQEKKLQAEQNQLRLKYEKKKQLIILQKLPQQQKKRALLDLAKQTDLESKKIKNKAYKSVKKSFNAGRARNSDLKVASSNDSNSSKSIEPESFYDLMQFQIKMSYLGQEIQRNDNPPTEEGQRAVDEYKKKIDWTRSQLASKYYLVWERGFLFPDMAKFEAHPELVGLYIKLQSFLNIGAGIEDFKGLTAQQRVAKLDQVMLEHYELFVSWENEIEKVYQGEKLKPSIISEFMSEAEQSALEGEIVVISREIEKRHLAIENSKLSPDEKAMATTKLADEFLKKQEAWQQKAYGLHNQARNSNRAQTEALVKKYKEAHGITDVEDKPYVHEFYKNAKPIEGVDLKTANSVIPMQWMDPMQVTDPILKQYIQKNKDLKKWEMKVRLSILLTEQEKQEKYKEISNAQYDIERRWKYRQKQLVSYADPKQVNVTKANIQTSPQQKTVMSEAQREFFNGPPPTNKDKPLINDLNANAPNQKMNFSNNQLATANQVLPPGQSANQPLQIDGLFNYDPSLAYNNGQNYLAKGSYTVKYKDDKGEEHSQEIPIVMGDSDKKELAEMSPERLAETAEELVREAQNPTKKGIRGNIIVGTTMRFPKSSATFFAGVGLVTLLDLMTKYEHNPVAMYQHFVAQKDPITHISFYMFMLASGSVQKPLSMFLKSPKAISRIPYLGMSVGMIASHLTTEVLNAFRECGNELMNSKSVKKSYPVCQRNYNELVLTDKIIDMAPGLVSMLLASQASAFVQRTVTEKLKTGVTAKLVNFGLKWGGVKLALSVLPGGVRVIGQELLLEVVQAFLFVGIQKYIDPWIITPFQNVLKGKTLDILSNDVADQIVTAKNEKWSISEKDCVYSDIVTNPYNLTGEPQKVCDKGLIGNLKELQLKMAAWRQFNLTQVMTAYQGWNQKIEKLSGMHDAAFNFYSYILDEIQAATEKRMIPVPKIWRDAPYNGVTPFVPPGFDPSDFDQAGVASPETLEKFQRHNVKQLIALIEREFIKGGLYDRESFPILQKAKLEAEYKVLLQIVEDISSESRSIEARGLTKIHDLRATFASVNNTSRMTDLLRKIVDFMGLPEPDMVPGRAFLYAFKKHPYYQTLFKDVEYPNRPARYLLNDISEYFIHQMICGPDIEKQEESVVDINNMECYSNTKKLPESAITESKGWRDELLPPQVRMPDDKVYYFCDKPDTPATNRMYSDKLYVDTKEGRQVFDGPLDYIGNRTRSSVQNGKFNDWWEAGIQSQVDNALLEYDKQYSIIARDFMKSSLTKTFSYQDQKLSQVVGGILDKLQDGKFDFFNAGPVSNGAIYALKQESRLYLLVLNEMLKDLWVPQMKKEELGTLLSTKQRYLKNNSFLNTYRENKLPLMIYFLHNAPFDLTRLVQSTPSYTHKYTGQASDSMIAGVEAISDRFTQFFTAFESLNENKNLSSQMKTLQKIKDEVQKLGTDIQKLRTDLGISADVTADTQMLLGEQPEMGTDADGTIMKVADSAEGPLKTVLNPAQLKLAKFCLEALEKLQKESESYAMMLTFVDTSADPNNMEQILNKSKERAEEIKEKLKK
jgi:hypothetical protein